MKKKPAARHSESAALASRSSRPWNIKPSVLANQKVERRVRKTMASASSARQGESLPVTRKQRSWQRFSGRDLGLRALEGSVYLVAGLSLLARNSLESLFGMFRNDPNEMYPASYPYQEGLDPFQSNQDLSDLADPERIEPELPGDPDPSEEFFDPRDHVEERKIFTLQEEEVGLSSDILEDQAGALRSLIAEPRE
ncbi:MAG: hypothetical protein HQL76_08490 [Magnetococcales bacterium]|nr:hypothetical protein [Magnetococcales bacterium]